MRRRSKKTKKHLIKHSLRRYYERYGEEISKSQIEEWNSQIKKSKDNIELLDKQSLTRSVYLIDKNIYAVYNSNLKCICTFITKEMYENDCYVYSKEN